MSSSRPPSRRAPPPVPAPADKTKEQTEPYESAEPFERFEIIHGIRYDFQPAAFTHQLTVTELAHMLRTTCSPNGIVVVAPIDVVLDEHTVQPDVVFIRNENLHIIKNQRIEGAPDMLAEILLPSTGKHDRSRKRALYESFGVNEYWIVDPRHCTVEQLVLDGGGRYALRAVYGGGDIIDSDTLSFVRIDVDQLFAIARRWEERQG